MKVKKPCKSILVVEDDADIREAIQHALMLEGFEVVCAKDGSDGLQKLRNMKDPTLVLLDLMMPSMSGWEFLRESKKDPQLAKNKFVTVSAVASTMSLEDKTPLEVDGSISKPIFLDSFCEQVKRFCELKEETTA